MGVHLEWLSDGVYLARWYDGDAEQAWVSHAPYKAVATLLVYPAFVWITGLHGVMTRSMRKDLVLALLEKGHRKAVAMRHGEYKEWDLLEESMEGA